MQGKHDKVITTLQKMAATNKKSLPDLLPNAKIEVTLSTAHIILYLDIIGAILVGWDFGKGFQILF